MPAVRLFRTPAGELSAPETAYVDLKGRKQKGRIKGNERMERKKGRRAAVTQSRWQIFHTLYLYVNVTYNVFGGMLNLTPSIIPTMHSRVTCKMLGCFLRHSVETVHIILHR